jgi:hypothetical protein
VIAEIFAPYRPADYAGVVDDHLRKNRSAPLTPVPLPT